MQTTKENKTHLKKKRLSLQISGLITKQSLGQYIRQTDKRKEAQKQIIHEMDADSKKLALQIREESLIFAINGAKSFEYT